MAKSGEMTSLCDRWGFFLVKVGCKAGKDEEGRGEGGDGGEAAGEHCKEEKPPGQWWQLRVKMFATSPVGQFHCKRRSLSVGEDGVGYNWSQEGGDKFCCEDGGVTASPHLLLILCNLLSIVVCSSVDFSLMGLHHSFCLRDSGFPASGTFELHVRDSLLLSFLLPIQPKVAVRGADQQDVEVVVSSSVLQSCNLGMNLLKKEHL